MAEVRRAEAVSEAFSGRIADVFTITGEGTFVLLENAVGQVQEGQDLEVYHGDALVGKVTLSGVKEVQRPWEENLRALHFKRMPEVRLERGQVLRTPLPEETVVIPLDPFVVKLAAFVSAIGYTTLAGLVTGFLLWLVYGLYNAGPLVRVLPVWLMDPVWLTFALMVSVLEVLLAAAWLTSFVWLRRLTTS